MNVSAKTTHVSTPEDVATRCDKAVWCPGVVADQDVTSPARDVDRAVRRGRQEIEMSCRIATVPMKRIAQLYVEVKRELRPVNYL